MHCICVLAIVQLLHNSLHTAWFHELYVRWAWFTHTPFAVRMQSMCSTQAVQKQHGLHCKKSNFRKVIPTNVKSSLNNSFLVEVIFLCDLNKNTLNMSLAKGVLFTLLTPVNTQVFVHNIPKRSPNFSNWVIWTNWVIYFKLYWLNVCCCCCHSHLAVMWIRVHIFTDLKFDDPHHVWESCAGVQYMCIS